MGKSRTRLTTFRRIARTDELSTTIMRLMIVCNDLAIAEDSLASWEAGQTGIRNARKTSARMYLVRLQIAHVFEALSIIKDIRQTPELLRAVTSCDQNTQNSFDRIENFMRTEDYKKMCRIRNNVTFHYDKKLVGKALTAEVTSNPNAQLSLSLGQAAIDWHFEPAEHVLNRIVVMDIFGIPPGTSFTVEVDKVLAKLQDVRSTFMDFSGHFIWRHTGR